MKKAQIKQIRRFIGKVCHAYVTHENSQDRLVEILDAKYSWTNDCTSMWIESLQQIWHSICKPNEFLRMCLATINRLTGFCVTKKNAGDCENHTSDCAKDCAVSTYTWQCQSTANGRCKNCCPPTQPKKCGGKKCNSKAWDKPKPPWNSDFLPLKMDGCKDLSGGRIVAK